jgi:hypothetical protein
MIKIILFIQILALTAPLSDEKFLLKGEEDIRSVYQQCGLGNELAFDVFAKAMSGMQKIGGIQNKNIITIVDYSKPSSKKRFYVIDLVNKHILYKTIVAHGKNSGDYDAKSFSNKPGSLKSCLGFFLTAETYNGKYGYSLCLDGLEPGINDNARKRAIVVHGADFVTSSVIKEFGRLGRSYGCPALPVGVSKEIIDKISKGSCLFIYGNDPQYFTNSKIINNQ